MKPQDESSAKGAHSHFSSCIFPTIFGLVHASLFCISFIFSLPILWCLWHSPHQHAAILAKSQIIFNLTHDFPRVKQYISYSFWQLQELRRFEMNL
jgi:hypothetical protein